MNTRKKMLILIAGVAILVIGVIIFKYENIQNKSAEKPGDIIFFPVMSSINSNVRETDFYNLHFAVRKDITSFFENIVSINLGDIDEIVITDYKLIKGDEAKDYKLYTLGLDIDYLKTGEYSFNSIFITTDNASQSFDIGEWYVHVEDSMSTDFIEIGEPYPILNMNFHEYRYALNNVSDHIIIVDEIVNDLIGKKVNEQIEPKRTLQKSYSIDMSQKYTEYNFFFVKPKIIYNVDGSENSFYPNGTIYIKEITDELIDKLAKGNN